MLSIYLSILKTNYHCRPNFQQTVDDLKACDVDTISI